MMLKALNKEKIWILLAGIFCLFGVIARFYLITANQFVYFDEGMWLNYQRPFLTMVEQNPPDSLSAVFKFVAIMFNSALGTGKALWAFLCSLRVLFVGVDGWFFGRMISAVFGVMTVGIVYLFSRKLFDCNRTALISVALMSIFPSHVYYSRLALQESASTFFFLTGLYLYWFSKRFSWRIVMSAIFFGFVFFLNYRMIIIPGILLFAEGFSFLTTKEKFRLSRLIWLSVLFFGMVFLIGAIDEGKNTYVTFGWMFHQSNLAKGHFDFRNLLSYPYYLFRLETISFGMLFFANLYFVYKREWSKLLPFAIVLCLMAVFSLPQEKGVRYLCAVMPLMVMSVSVLISFLINEWTDRRKWIVYGVCGWLVLSQLFCVFEIMQFRSDYEKSMNLLTSRNPDVKVLSTQPEIQKLFAASNKHVMPVYGNINYLVKLYQGGFEYLVLDPQAYVSQTSDKKRFSFLLNEPVNFILTQVKPLETFDHFHPRLLERFVLEHNENLFQSLKFLKENKKQSHRFEKLYLYDLRVVLAMLKQRLSSQEVR